MRALQFCGDVRYIGERKRYFFVLGQYEIGTQVVSRASIEELLDSFYRAEEGSYCTVNEGTER